MLLGPQQQTGPVLRGCCRLMQPKSGFIVALPQRKGHVAEAYMSVSYLAFVSKKRLAE